MSTVAQRSFAGGELSPDAYARADLAKYASGAKQVRNFMVMRHGGVTNRPGSGQICEVKDSEKTVRFIPFEFNDQQTYVLEFGDLYMRVIRNGIPVTDQVLNITGISNASVCVVTHGGPEPTYPNDGDEMTISGVEGPISQYLNQRNFKVANVNAPLKTFELQYMDGTDVDSTAFGAYTTGGTAERIYEIVSPFPENDLRMLKYDQSADVITLTNANHAVRELSRTGDSSWAFSSVSFAPTIGIPTGGAAVAGGGLGSTTVYYKVSAIATLNGEEGLPSTEISQVNVSENLAPPVAPGVGASSYGYVDLTWNSVTGASTYNIYKKKYGIYGLIGISGDGTFRDIGQDVDTTDTPPEARDPFNGTGNYPACVCYYQQRHGFAGSNLHVERAEFSRTAIYRNFTKSNPVQDDDAITFDIVGSKVNAIRHMIDLGTLLVGTANSWQAVQGGADGVLKPGEINPKRAQAHGVSDTVAPVVIGDTALYVQARGSIIRDLAYEMSANGYKGDELTIFSSHLFDKYQIVAMAYQEIPHSIVWVVRSDGMLLGFTYKREHQVWAWHRHDFVGGTVEDVVCVPEGNLDAVYLVVKREVDGRQVRYIERLSDRRIQDIKDIAIVDSYRTYDGRNSDISRTMTLSGTEWTSGDELTITSSKPIFKTYDIGNEIQLIDDDGGVIRFSMQSYVSSTQMNGYANRDVPIELQTQAKTDWTFAVDVIDGLWHIEGSDVSVFGDGLVVANPNNAQLVKYTVEKGSITLDRPYGVIQVGIPITSDLELLNLEVLQGETLVDKPKLINQVTIQVEESRGGWVGDEPPPDEATDYVGGLQEIKVRDHEDYDSPVDLVTGIMDAKVQARWNDNGRVFVRQTDPVPLTILAIAPAGYVPGMGG